MLSYEVTLDVEPDKVEAVEKYMLDKHIPELWATGCFYHIRFARASPTRFRTSYCLSDQAQLDDYTQRYAQKLRDDFAAHFPSGVSPGRETWHTVKEWGDATAA